jgi:hypothetical protein
MSKQFKPTYLYIKTHNITGLKYFGKTTDEAIQKSAKSRVGLTRSEETKQKMRKPKSEQAKENMRKAQQARFSKLTQPTSVQ